MREEWPREGGSSPYDWAREKGWLPYGWVLLAAAFVCLAVALLEESRRAPPAVLGWSASPPAVSAGAPADLLAEGGQGGKTAALPGTEGAGSTEVAEPEPAPAREKGGEGGGPSPARPQAPRTLPPLPSDAALAQQAAPPPVAPAPPVPSPAATPQPRPPSPAPSATATRSVTTTAAHPVNIRSHPRGGGAVVRVVPRASVLRVFGEAPGGWFQVGEDQPFGWVHGSMLKR
jgi:Bacterial SH3 domain